MSNVVLQNKNLDFWISRLKNAVCVFFMIRVDLASPIGICSVMVARPIAPLDYAATLIQVDIRDWYINTWPNPWKAWQWNMTMHSLAMLTPISLVTYPSNTLIQVYRWKANLLLGKVCREIGTGWPDCWLVSTFVVSPAINKQKTNEVWQPGSDDLGNLAFPFFVVLKGWCTPAWCGVVCFCAP